MFERRNYDTDKTTLNDLIRTYNPSDAKGSIPIYLQQIINISKREANTFTFNLEDLREYDQKLLDIFYTNTQRYVSILQEIVDELVIEFRPKDAIFKDTLDVFIQHRILIEANAMQLKEVDTTAMAEISKKYPSELLRRYQIAIEPPKDYPNLLIRNIKAKSIGNIVKIKSIVTKISDVKPMMQVATYTCDVCACEIYQVVTSITFTPVTKCTSPECVSSRAGGRLFLQTRGSKMTKFQEIKVQEMSSEVPTGSIPRTLTVCLLGDLCRSVKPGDHIMVNGILFPTSTDVMSKMAAGVKNKTGSALSCDMYINAHTVKILNKMDGTDTDLGQLTEEELSQIHEDNFYDKLACSIAPEIYGYTDLKKALLLVLISGTTVDINQMHIRGDIHMCLMGDPGVAKSQLLSFIGRLSSRSQQVSGKGSSGVGLTASVVKDALTGETTLQGGALVLSDGGMACIDEFDKMSDVDRTAIHEVMEQQTVSIAKAGINAILNARTSILAAANPAYSKYDPKKSLSANIDLPSALLSRFDLLWLLTDNSNQQNDLRLAEHIVYVHKNSVHPPLEFEPIDVNLMKKYIAFARQKQPLVPENLTELIVEKYVEIRKDARTIKNSTFLSARALLSILRLSTALAKLRLADEVTQDDVMEAFRLTEASQESLRVSEADKISKVNKNSTQRIFEIIKEMFDETNIDQENVGIAINDLTERCFARGFRQDQIDSCIREYTELNVLLLGSNGTHLSIV